MGECDDFNNELREKYTGKMKTGAEHRKRKNKPLLEKRRRARINESLVQLKALVLQSMQHDTAQYSKLEKADILEMTVSHLIQLQKQHVSSRADMLGMLSKFRVGYNECSHEVVRYLSEDMEGVAPEVRTRLLNHLASCIASSNNSSRKVDPDNVLVCTSPAGIDTTICNKPGPNQSGRDFLEARFGNGKCGVEQMDSYEQRNVNYEHNLRIVSRHVGKEPKRPAANYRPLQNSLPNKNRSQLNPNYTEDGRVERSRHALWPMTRNENHMFREDQQLEMNAHTCLPPGGSIDNLLMTAPYRTNNTNINVSEDAVLNMGFSSGVNENITPSNARGRNTHRYVTYFPRRDINNNQMNTCISKSTHTDTISYTDRDMTGRRFESLNIDQNEAEVKVNFGTSVPDGHQQTPMQDGNQQTAVHDINSYNMDSNMFNVRTDSVWRPW